jgi:hypothetical protein
MVEYPHVNQAKGLYQRAGEAQVGVARFAHAGRVVVRSY